MEKKKIVDLEDLIAWQKAKNLSVQVYKSIKTNNILQKDFSFCDQFKRAALSVSLNIAEGFGRGGNREFQNFLGIASGSLLETKTMVIIGAEINYFTINEKKEFLDRIIELEKIIKGLQNYLKNSEHKGFKYNKVEESAVDYHLIDGDELLSSLNSKLST